MRVDILPKKADITPGVPQPVTVTITNDTDVIGGYSIRVLGADPNWVQVTEPEVSLFPDETRTVAVIITPPRGIQAGSRRIAVQVRELTPPLANSISELDLTVPEIHDLQMRVDPMAVTAGRQARLSVLVENTGNCMLHGKLAGHDPEEKVEFAFDPPLVTLAPGEHLLAELRAKAKRPLTGEPLVRLLELGLDDHDPDGFFTEDPERAPVGSAARRPASAPPVPGTSDEDERPVLARATFIQKSVLTRGVWSLIGLLLAVTTFAFVITIAMSRLVGQTTADRNLALQVAAAQNQTASTGTSSLSGTVSLLTSKSTASVPQKGVAVEIFESSDSTTPIATTATDDSGAYTVPNLAAGKYKISFHASGFVQLWYPGAATADDATTVTLKPDQQEHNIDVRIGGVPATISGTVVGDDVSDATLYLEQPPAGGAASGGTSGTGSGSGSGTGSTGSSGTGSATSGTGDSSGGQVTTDSSGAAVAPDDGGAVVQTTPIGSDGTFSLVNVPSPSTYDLVVVKSGYATSTQLIDVGAGETRSGVELTLEKGDGEITGSVTSPKGPLSGVTIVATAGQSTSSTVSLTGASAGLFTLRSLPTPATLTIRASKPGYTSQTQTVTLSSGQAYTGVSISLSPSSGSLTGVVTVVPDTSSATDPAASSDTTQDSSGVTVSVSNGAQSVDAVTEGALQGGQAGAWKVTGLALPGTYTVTFTRSDLATQTVSVSLDAGGNVTTGSVASITMHSSTARLFGTVTQRDGGTNVCDAGSSALGEATVTLQSGNQTYTTTSASLQPHCGQYEVENVQPGTYTLSVGAGSGTSPWSKVVTLVAGQARSQPVGLKPPASISGLVRSPGVQRRWTVFLYPISDYPTTPLASTTTVDGHFTFADVDAGQYVLAAGPTSDPSNATATTQVTVQPSAPRRHIVIKVTQ